MAKFEDLFPPYHAFGSRTLSPGDQGTDVAVLQTVYNEMLKVMNPPLGPMGSPIPVTGSFNAPTHDAVINIQSYFGIAADGIVGPDTFWLFGQGVDGHVTYGGPAYGSRTLAQGAQGGDVTVLQNRLNLFRYSVALGGPADGIYGPKTAQAVTEFQADAAANGDTGLATDGVVGPATFDASWIYTYAGGRGLFVGRNGFDVAFIQVLLQKLGFYTGPIHGFFGDGMQQAVSRFQASAGIAADGIVGQQTYHALGLRNAVAAPSPLPVPPIERAPEFTDCCLTLTPQVPATEEALWGPPGGVVWIRQMSNGFSSISVNAFLLPDPSTFDPTFDTYIFTCTHCVIPEQPMHRVLGTAVEQEWTTSRSQSYGAPVNPAAVVSIYAGRDRDVLGPLVLQGTFADCR